MSDYAERRAAADRTAKVVGDVIEAAMREREIAALEEAIRAIETLAAQRHLDDKTIPWPEEFGARLSALIEARRKACP